jgi:hypothetical protein
MPRVAEQHRAGGTPQGLCEFDGGVVPCVAGAYAPRCAAGGAWVAVWVVGDGWAV